MERNIGRSNTAAGSESPAAARPKRVVVNDPIAQVKDIFYLCLSRWWWFLLSLGIALGIAVLKIKTTVPVYQRTASILIKSEDKTSDISALTNMGLTQIPVNITNEILSLKSGTVAAEVVRRLHLEVEYIKDGTFHDEIVYGSQQPVEVSFLDLHDNESASFRMRFSGNKNAIISHLVHNGTPTEGSLSIPFNDTVKTSLGRIVITPTRTFKEHSGEELTVRRSNIYGVTASVQGRIDAYLRNNSSIIDITFRDVSPSRAEDVLNTLVAVYNENWVKDRNQKTINTNQFIKERLAFIEQELGDVEQEISDWKSQNLILDVGSAGGTAMGEASGAEAELRELNNQMYMTRFVRNYLTDGQHENQLLPNNLGMTNPSITGQISEYNRLLLQRNNHLANSSLQNPLVIDMDEQLANMRNSIIQSLDYEITILQAKQNNIQSFHRQAVAKIASNPQQSLHLLSVERQQKVKEQLYMFLLQKREENELTQAFAAYNSQLVEPPHGSGAPIKPVPNAILMMAFIIGLAIPGGTIALREILNTKVRGRKDIEQLSVPFVGEIPLSGKPKKWWHLRRQKKETPQVVVQEKNRNIINEAFRVVRTNMEFMLGFENNHQIIMLTSVNPGSGKTFISANLSAALGIKNKKVLAIDLDLRKGSLSEYVDSPRKGVSNYLSGQESDYKELIVKLGPVDVLPCGTIPPNPTELLFVPRFREMLEEVRAEYDYVFIDCPPVEIVADAAIINHYADLTLFVVRTGLMERAFLPDIEQWYEEKKYKNLSLILNGSTEAMSRYGYHKYGYHYGKYGYGHTK
ncbi:MAG: polysaccharide biosynthesis tyrosine autokinase [Coprobacter sp.]|nr:polysaccharide biosynthesis tyrosine autokinase [Coprobacter sp.]